MSDDIDRAQEREQQDRELALRASAARRAASYTRRNADVDGTCIDCDEPIEPERLAALDHKTSRCASCARDFEHRNRGYRW